MPRSLRLAGLVALICSIASFVAPNAHSSVLFVLDGRNGRILWFDANGRMHMLAPLPGRENFLASPKAIATDGANELIVLNGDYPQLVLIDVPTGTQYELGGQAAFSFGSQPNGLAIDPRNPPLLSYAPLYVGALGELDVVHRTIQASTASLLGSFPSGWELASSQFVATHDPGSGPVDVFASTDLGIVGYDGSQTGVFWVPPQGSVMGLDAVDFQSVHELFFSYQYAACPSDYNGLYFFDDSAGVTQHTNFTDVQPFATGGNVACPGAIAVTKDIAEGIPPTPVYVVDRGSSPQRIFVIYSPILNSSLFATLPGDADADGLVIYTPEPEIGRLGAAAVLAVASVATRRRVAPGA